MKKILVAFALAVVASAASAQIAGSRHDFSTNGLVSPAPLYSCKGCHTAHGATMSSNLIWAASAYTTAGYTVYSGGGTIDAKGVGACLSCHSTNTFTGQTASMTTTALGTDLGTSHPVGSGFTIGDATAGFQTTIVLGGFTVTAGTAMTCASCHSVHNVGVATVGRLVKSYGTASNICVACHNK